MILAVFWRYNDFSQSQVIARWQNGHKQEFRTDLQLFWILVGIERVSGAVCDCGLGGVGDGVAGRDWLWCGEVGMWVGRSRELDGVWWGDVGFGNEGSGMLG